MSARRPLRTLSSMLRSPWWRVGLLLGATGFVLHLSALALAPISLVQAFVAGGLALVAPLAARAFHHHLTRAERRAVPLMAASLAALALGISDPTRHLHFDAASLWLYLAALMLVATLLATAVEGRFRHPALGLAAGLFYGALDSSTKGLADLFRSDGPAAVIRSPLLLVAVAAGVTAFFCFQRALQTNRPLTAIAVMEAGATGGGVMAGFIAFGDSLGTAPGIELLHLAAFVGVGIAAWTPRARPDPPGRVSRTGGRGECGERRRTWTRRASARRSEGRRASGRARAASRVLPGAPRCGQRPPGALVPARTPAGCGSAGPDAPA